jgi:hypothetical protein
VIVLAVIIGWIVFGLVSCFPITTILSRADIVKGWAAAFYAMLAVVWPVTLLWLIAYFLLGKSLPARLEREEKRAELKERIRKTELALYEQSQKEIAEYVMTPQQRAEVLEAKAVAAQLRDAEKLVKVEKDLVYYSERRHR